MLAPLAAQDAANGQIGGEADEHQRSVTVRWKDRHDYAQALQGNKYTRFH